MVRIYLCGGNIVDVQADVALCSIHRSKDMTMGPLAGQFLKACGQTVQDQIYRESDGDLDIGQIVTTSSGKRHNLKKVFFICLYRYLDGNELILQNSLLECLRKAEDLGYSSIAIPALGTGGLHYPPKKVAPVMMQAVAQYNEEYPDTSLKEVTFVFREEDLNIATIFFQACFPVPTRVQDPKGDVSNMSGSSAGGGSQVQSAKQLWISKNIRYGPCSFTIAPVLERDGSVGASFEATIQPFAAVSSLISKLRASLRIP